MECPGVDTLGTLLAGALPETERAAIADHAAWCDRCHALMEGLIDPQPPGETALGLDETLSLGGGDPASALELGRGAMVGRYVIEERLGAGGMGVVYAALDSELHRRVALKLLRPDRHGGGVGTERERLLREARTLARLSHPNVVTVFDIGAHRDRLFVAMELVAGGSLGAWLRHGPRAQDAILDRLIEAARGLAAAHTAGVVHRDVKPDNILVGADGRARVTDFGLAQLGDPPAAPDDPERAASAPLLAPQLALTRTGALMGTPAYMAPEQWVSGETDERTDQWSFCATLYEALAGVRPFDIVDREAHASAIAEGRLTAPAAGRRVPGWALRIVARGLRADPAMRWPSMGIVVHALVRGRHRRRRAAIATAAVLVVATAFAFGRSATSRSEPELCAGADAELAEIWNDAARAGIASHLTALGPTAGQEIAGVTRDLDAYGVAWSGAHRHACAAYQRGELTATLYDRRLGCLSRSKAALGAVAELLASVSPATLDNALVAARSLPDAGRCADQDAVQIAPAPERVARRVDAVALEVERARVLAVAGHPDAEPAARAAVRDAEGTAYVPLIARALLVQGRAESAMEREVAASSLSRAVRLAIEAGDEATAVEAFARLIYVSAGKDVDGLSLIEPMAVRPGPRGVFGRALLYNNLATMRLARGDRPGARKLLLRARGELPADPAQVDIELVCISQNLALVAATAPERETELEKAADKLERVLGPSHPKTLEARAAHARATENGELARVRMARACERYRRYQPQLAAAARCDYELGWLVDEIDEVAAAVSAMQRAAADLPRVDRKRADLAAGYVAVSSPAAGDGARRAIAGLRELGRMLATASGIEDRIIAADAYIAAARGDDRLGERAGAVASWRAALALLEQVDHPLFRRRLARTRAAVARHLARTDAGESQRLARLARDWYTAAGGYEQLLRELPR